MESRCLPKKIVLRLSHDLLVHFQRTFFYFVEDVKSSIHKKDHQNRITGSRDNRKKDFFNLPLMIIVIFTDCYTNHELMMINSVNIPGLSVYRFKPVYNRFRFLGCKKTSPKHKQNFP